ncbi:MAG: LysR family transcriptional regulator [Pseudomonadota bacterium]
MDRPPPPLNLVRSFESAARHLSFTLAARELGFTQAAISGHVRSLEHYIGQQLFHRNARSLVLTETGKAFLPTLRDALSQIDAATEAIATTRRGEQIILSCPVSLAESVVVGKVYNFLDENPSVRISIHGAVWENASEAVADLKLSFQRNHEAEPNATLLSLERLVLVCNQTWQTRLNEGLSFSEMPIISILGRHDYWDTFVAELDDMRDLAAIRHHANSLNIAMEMAAHGFGATVTLSSLAQSYLDRGLVVEPLEHRPESPWGCYITPGSGVLKPASQRLLKWLTENPADAP